MSKPSKSSDEHVGTPLQKSAVVLLLGDVADTTWRLSIPTIGLTALGIWIDRMLHTTPWMLVVGVCLGTTAAVLLLRQQLQRINR